MHQHFRLAVRWGLTAVCLSLATPARAQVTYPVTFAASANVLTAPEKAALTSHFQEAGRRWARKLAISGPRSIEIEIAVDNAIPRINGRSETSFFVGVFGGRETFEQGAAQELRTGTDPNAGARDIVININTTYLRTEMWFDPDPSSRSTPVPLNLTDAMSLALHELGHALAYNGFANGNGVPPPAFWSTFDRWIDPGPPTAFFEGPAAVPTWGTAPELTTSNIHHWGNAAPASPAQHWPAAPSVWSGGVPVPQVACQGPVSMDVPPSLSREDLALLGGTLLDELMNGVVFIRGSRYDISLLDVAVLKDVGLPADPGAVFGDGFEGVAQ